MVELRSPRLVLRQWRETDLEPFAALNADPEVMRHFPSRLTRGQSAALAERERKMIGDRGWGLWAVEVIQGAPFIGFVSLAEPRFQAHFTPAVEVGWRLARDHWRSGYATEAACATVAFGFRELSLDEIVSFTSVVNERSQKVMERIGMTHDPADDFDHPNLAPDDPLTPHVLYRIRAETRRSGCVEHVRADDPELASYLRIEERELEAAEALLLVHHDEGEAHP
jgi:RimJ/RimL family protein N-acetyltransferase